MGCLKLTYAEDPCPLRVVYKNEAVGELSGGLKKGLNYYPHGGVLPGRQYVSSTGYKFGYQGQEYDTETGLSNFELRQYDARIGRWFAPDPYGQYHSPYLAMGNNPVSSVDPDGGWSSDENNGADYMDCGFNSAFELWYFNHNSNEFTSGDRYDNRMENMADAMYNNGHYESIRNPRTWEVNNTWVSTGNAHASDYLIGGTQPLTTFMLRDLAREEGVTSTGIVFNREVGKAFEQLALIEFLAFGKQPAFDVPERQAKYNISTVIPDASMPINIFYSEGNYRGKKTVDNASLYEVKAVNGTLELSTSKGQIKAIIDVAARAVTSLDGKPASVTFITTSNTFISDAVIMYATQKKVLIYQAIAGLTSDNRIVFSSPHVQNRIPGIEGSMNFELKQLRREYPASYLKMLKSIPELLSNPDPESVD